jgi:C_GCAxxG_C_C family probable redox protein
VSEHLWGDADPEIARIAIAFGGGVGGTHKELCGAFTGGVMVLGRLWAPEQPGGDETRLRDAIARYRQRFLQEIGPMTCDALTSTKYGNGKAESCTDLVQHAVRSLLSVIDEFSGNEERGS